MGLSPIRLQPDWTLSRAGPLFDIPETAQETVYLVECFDLIGLLREKMIRPLERLQLAEVSGFPHPRDELLYGVKGNDLIGRAMNEAHGGKA